MRARYGTGGPEFYLSLTDPPCAFNYSSCSNFYRTFFVLQFYYQYLTGILINIRSFIFQLNCLIVDILIVISRILFLTLTVSIQHKFYTHTYVYTSSSFIIYFVFYCAYIQSKFWLMKYFNLIYFHLYYK